MIRLVDVNENVRTVRQKGQMNNTSTSHKKVLDAFTHRAVDLCGKTRTVDDDVRRLSTIDETGTLDLSGLNIYNENDALQQEMKEMNDIPVPEEVLQIHGFAPPKKADGTVRLIYENVDGINTRLCDNEKVERMKELHDDLEVDVAAYCEHKINYKHRRNINVVTEIFKYMLWVIADYWDSAPVTNIALQEHGGVRRTPSMPQV